MKIIRTIETFYPVISGPANQAFMISKKLGEKGIESPIYTSNYCAKDSPVKEEVDGVNVVRFSSRLRVMKYIETPGMKKKILGEKPDIIHAHNFRSYQTEIGYRCAKQLEIPFVINTHGGLLGYKSITKGIKQMPYILYDKIRGRNIIKGADTVIVSSKQEYEEALKFGVSKEKLHIIPMGIDVEEYEKIKRTRKDDKNVLLFVGRICRDRNILPILQAMKSLDDSHELRIVGEAVKRSDTEKAGYLDELKVYAKKNKLNAVFTGPKYGDELKKEYRNADIFVYTSLWENFGQTLLEAAAAGLPIISTPVGIAREIVKNGETGYIIDYSNQVESVIKCIRRYIDSNLRNTMGKKLRNTVKHNFEWDDVVAKYEKVYLKVISEKT